MLCEVSWNSPNFENEKPTYTGLFMRYEDFAPSITKTFHTYEAAESALLNELLTLLERKKNE